jgi:hypothetical protein
LTEVLPGVSRSHEGRTNPPHAFLIPPLRNTHELNLRNICSWKYISKQSNKFKHATLQRANVSSSLLHNLFLLLSYHHSYVSLQHDSSILRRAA